MYVYSCGSYYPLFHAKRITQTSLLEPGREVLYTRTPWDSLLVPQAAGTNDRQAMKPIK